MARKKQNPEENIKRQQILETAATMFMSHGFSAISMDALAKAVPVSKRTLYDHFGDKKAIFTAVMQSRCQFISGKLEQSIGEGKSVEETLKNIGRQFLDIVLRPESINIYRTAINESQSFPELGKLFFESGPKRSIGVVSSYFHKVNIENPELAAKIFIGMLTNRIHMQCMLGLKKKVSAEEKGEIVDYAVKVFMHGQKKE